MACEITAATERGVINVWQPTDFNQLELHRGISVARPVPRHWHEQFQLCLIEAGTGDLTYRGVSFATPPRVSYRSPRRDSPNRCFLPRAVATNTFYRSRSDAARGAEMFGRDRGAYFQLPLCSKAKCGALPKLHVVLENPASTLERESCIQAFSTTLIANSASRASLSTRSTENGQGQERL